MFIYASYFYFTTKYTVIHDWKMTFTTQLCERIFAENPRQQVSRVAYDTASNILWFRSLQTFYTTFLIKRQQYYFACKQKLSVALHIITISHLDSRTSNNVFQSPLYYYYYYGPLKLFLNSPAWVYISRLRSNRHDINHISPVRIRLPTYSYYNIVKRHS